MYLGPIWRILDRMHSGGTWRLGHRPALDGLRAIAVLMVMAAHFNPGHATLFGTIGVTVFFTLSGFLITTLSLDEHGRTGRISRLGFYRRRALRLFPALAAMLFVICLLTVAGLPTNVTGGMVASVLGYVSNWYLMATISDGGVWGALGHTWSLAIEEQFYVVWPFVVMLAVRRGRRGVLTVATSGALLSVVWALVSGRSTLASDVSAYSLLVGCALAAWMQGRRETRPPRWIPAGAVLALFGLVAAGQDAHRAAYVAVPLLTAAAIWVAVQRPVAWLSMRPLVWVGRRSYGLYLWHVPVAYLCFHTAMPFAAAVVVGVSISFGMTVLSWRYVETPFLRLKDRATPTVESPRRPTSLMQTSRSTG